MNDDERQLLQNLADELRSIAAWGINFALNPHDIERYEAVLTASATLTAVLTDKDPVHLLQQYEAHQFLLGPQASAEAVVTFEDHILLVQRGDDGLWALPGGITDPGETLAETAVRELEEETGLYGIPQQLLGLFDSRLWHSDKRIHFYHGVFLVHTEQKRPQLLTTETIAADYFPEDKLPPLSPGHHLRVPHVFAQLRGDAPIPFFDGLMRSWSSKVSGD